MVLAGCSNETKPAEKSAAPMAGAAVGSVVRLDPAADALLPKDAQIEKVAGGFTFIEGPLWRPNGALWFSDVVGNVVRQWSPDGKVNCSGRAAMTATVFRREALTDQMG
jgi:sugar lactone lactonase YvrE